MKTGTPAAPYSSYLHEFCVDVIFSELYVFFWKSDIHFHRRKCNSCNHLCLMLKWMRSLIAATTRTSKTVAKKISMANFVEILLPKLILRKRDLASQALKCCAGTFPKWVRFSGGTMDDGIATYNWYINVIWFGDIAPMLENFLKLYVVRVWNFSTVRI